MIEYIHGIVESCADHKVILKTTALSFGVMVPHSHNFKPGSPLSLHIYFYWNQETGPALFGFESSLEKDVFMLIIGCNGVGPKLALTILRDLGASHFLQAITTHDDKALSNVSGIGSKKAEQIIVQLKHKVQKMMQEGLTFDQSGPLSVWHDVDQALASLSYSRSEISRTLEVMKKDQATHTLPFDQLLRKALSQLTRKQ